MGKVCELGKKPGVCIPLESQKIHVTYNTNIFYTIFYLFDTMSNKVFKNINFYEKSGNVISQKKYTYYRNKAFLDLFSKVSQRKLTQILKRAYFQNNVFKMFNITFQMWMFYKFCIMKSNISDR